MRLPLLNFTPNRAQLPFLQGQAIERWLFMGNRAGKSAVGEADLLLDGFGMHLWRPSFATKTWKYDQFEGETLLYKAGNPLYNQREEFAGRAERGQIVAWDAAPDYPNVWKPNSFKLLLNFFKAAGFREGSKANEYTWKEAERYFTIPVELEAEGEVFSWEFRIYAKSYDAGRAKFQASGVAIIHFDEELPYDIYEEGTLRAEADYDLWVTCTLTPVKALPWMDEKVWGPFELGTLPKWRQVFRGTMFDNLENLPESFVEKQMERFPEGSHERKVRIEGEFARREGLVYPDFDAAVHVVDDFTPSRDEHTLYRCVDVGIRNPTACLWLAVNREGEVFVYKEYYERELPLNVHAKNILAVNGEDPIRWTAIDPAAAQRDKVSGTSPLDYFSMNGIPCIPAPNAVIEGVTKVTEYLQVHPKLERPRLFFCRRCVNTVQEMRSLRWAPQTTQAATLLDPKEKIHKRNDHAADALRYGLMLGPKYMPESVNVEEEYVGGRYTGY